MAVSPRLAGQGGGDRTIDNIVFYTFHQYIQLLTMDNIEQDLLANTILLLETNTDKTLADSQWS